MDWLEKMKADQKGAEGRLCAEEEAVAIMKLRRTPMEMCPSCGVNPAEDGRECSGCDAYREHTAVY